MDIWDPFKDIPFPSSSLFVHGFSREIFTFANACVNWKETQNVHVFKDDLSGIKKEEVKMEVEDDKVLQISGERSVEKEDRNNTWHRVERSSRKFMRRFRLLENVEMEGIRASMEDGVLTVIAPKEEVKRPE